VCVFLKSSTMSTLLFSVAGWGHGLHFCLLLNLLRRFVSFHVVNFAHNMSLLKVQVTNKLYSV
jgi:hypothetical protein